MAEFFGGSSKAERTHLSLLLSRKKMASIRDPVAVAGAVAPPAGTATLSELHGSAQAIRVLAPWIEVTGTGAADNPYSCSRADLSALMSCAAVLDNTVGGPAIVASRLSSAQMAALWDAVQSVGDGDSQEPLDLTLEHSRGSLELELSWRRDLLSSSARRAEIVVDVAGLEAVDVGAQAANVPDFLRLGMTWDKGSVASNETGSIEAYSIISYFAPELYSVGGFEDAASTGLAALRRLGSSLTRWLDERTGDPNIAANMTAQELAVTFRDYGVRLLPPPALRIAVAPGNARLSQLTTWLMRLKSIEKGDLTHIQEEVSLLPQALSSGRFLDQLHRILAGASASVVAESLTTLAKASGAADTTPSLKLASQLNVWLRGNHRATLDAASGDAAAKVTAIVQACADRESRAAQMTLAAASGRTAPTAGVDASSVGSSGPTVTRLSKADGPQIEALMLDGRFPAAVRKVEAILHDSSQQSHLALQLALSGASAGHPDGQPFALLVQIGCGHMAANALAITTKLNTIHTMHARMLGSVTGALVSESHVHHTDKRLAKEFHSNDWGLAAAKDSDKSVINFVAARNLGAHHTRGSHP